MMLSPSATPSQKPSAAPSRFDTIPLSPDASGDSPIHFLHSAPFVLHRFRRPFKRYRMILHLRHENKHLSLSGEAFGVAVSDDSLYQSLAFLFRGWRKVILKDRGVLQVLHGVSRGLTSPTLIYGNDIRDAAKLWPLLLRVVAAGCVAPVIENDEARWRATVVPEGCDATLFQMLVDLWMRTTTSTVLSRSQAAKGKFYTADDALLTALRSPKATLSITSDTLSAEVNQWAAPLFEGGRSSLPLVPRRDHRGWWIEFTEPDVSTSDGFSLAKLRLLGQAVTVAPTLGLPQPWSDSAFARFLREAVPVLRAAAFTIPLPPELEHQVPHLNETAAELTNGVVRIERTIVFAGTELSVAEAQAIVDAGEPLVFLNDKWHYLDLQALRNLLHSIGPEEMTARQALPLLLAGALRISPDAQDIQNFLREMTQPPEGELPLRDVLRPYQAQGVCWLMQAAAHHLGVCLADDMGLGKTLQTIAFLLSRSGPTLVVAPLTVLPVWEREFTRWAPHLKILRHDGPERIQDTGFIKLAMDADVVLTAYGYLWRDYTSLRRVTWNTLVLDEAQLIKNPQTRQSQAARSLPATFRLALTGTPIENRLEDLWCIFDFLNPNLFGSRREFTERYREPERLRKAVTHFLLRRQKSDPGILAELPPKILQEHYTPLTEAQTAAYDLALAEYTRDSRNGEASGRTGAVLALLTRLKQICNGVELDTDHAFSSGKLDVLIPLLETILERGESVLIFTQFARTGARVQALLAERFEMPIPFIHGDLSAKQRHTEIEAFNRKTQPGIFILSLRTGAFGLTLTKANHVIHLDRWWNPAVEAQATDRVHRIGQKRTVVVHHLICRGTLEDNIARLLREKQFLADTVVAPTPAALLSRLPTDTLLGILRRKATS